MTISTIAFEKMNGIGNAIIVADRRGDAPAVTAEAAVALATRHGLPFDQIMEIRDPSGRDWDYDIRILNSDGSQAQACGNGMRCVVAWLNRETGGDRYIFRTARGILNGFLHDDGAISVEMGAPRFDWEAIPLAEEFRDTTGIELQIGPIDAPVLHTPSVVNMGNPHAIFWVDRDPDGYDLHLFGPLLENHPLFPERANITLAQVIDRDHIRIRVWERGAGLTLACGSAACATLVAAARKGLADRRAVIALPGGDLAIEWRADNNVVMTGPAEFEFSGRLDPQDGTWQRLDGTGTVASAAS